MSWQGLFCFAIHSIDWYIAEETVIWDQVCVCVRACLYKGVVVVGEGYVREKSARTPQTLIESRWKSISTAFLIDRSVSCFLWRCQTLNTHLPLPLSIFLLSIILLFTHHYLGNLFQISLRYSSIHTRVALSVWIYFLSITLSVQFYFAQYFWRRSSSALSVGHLKLLADTTLIFPFCNLHSSERERDVKVAYSTYTQHTNSPLWSSDVWKKRVGTHLFSLTSIHTNVRSCMERKGKKNGIVPLYCLWPDFWNVTQGEKSSHLRVAFTQIGIKGFHLGSPFSEGNAVYEVSLSLFQIPQNLINDNDKSTVYHTIFEEFMFCWWIYPSTNFFKLILN